MRKIINILFLTLLSFEILGQTNSPFKFTIVKNIEATDVKNQGSTGTCWSFSTASFIESEIIRKTGKKIDLSEMFVVRKIYMEKAVLYLRFHGKANFSQGALAHDLFYVLKTYGMMPEAVYNGKNNKSDHNHNKLEVALKQYLDSVLLKPSIDPHWAAGFEAILYTYLGVCPAIFKYDNITYNAMSFGKSLGINMDDYVGITSYTHHPFYELIPLEIPDNFSHGWYYNVPIDPLIEIIVNSINLGYTVEWDGDVSEPGFGRKGGAAVLLKKGETLQDSLPNEETVTQAWRQATFDSHETTDDHLMHITGIATDQKGHKYFITKNSWGNTNGIDGYIYISENYMRLKTVSIFVNKKAIPKSVKWH